MKIRKAALDDVPKLVSLNQAVQAMHADALPERFRRHAAAETVARAFTTMIEAPSSYWLVAEEEQLLGFLSSAFHEREESWCLVPHRACYLAGIVVAAGFRRRGIARALVAALQGEAEARGVASIELDVWAFNPEAREAFAKLGFIRLTERMALSTNRRTSRNEKA